MRRINCTNNPMDPLHDRAEPCGLFAEEQLADFAMGRLPDGEKARMEEHRRRCRSCDAMIHEWTELLGQAAIGIGPVFNDSEGGGSLLRIGRRICARMHRCTHCRIRREGCAAS